MTPLEQRQGMIRGGINPTPDFTRLLTITAPELGTQDDGTKKTEKPKELHTNLIERFSSGDDAVTKANSVIATLPSRNNLERVGKHLRMFLRFIRTALYRAERYFYRRSFPEMLLNLPLRYTSQPYQNQTEKRHYPDWRISLASRS